MTLDPTTAGLGAGGEALLERTDELAALEAVAARAGAGRGGVVALIGPAGIGKTSLLDAAREQARARGFAVLAARGGELERDFPYGVARQLLERALRELPASRRSRVLGGAAEPAAAALGIASASGSEELFAVVHGLYWACANLTSERPLMLAIDDAHWADAPSLRFLCYLARRAGELPLVLAVAARPAAEAEVSLLLDALVGGADVLTLRPAALSDEGVGELLRHAFGTPVEHEIARACRQAAAGNPFLCRALIGALAERPAMPEAADVEAVAARSVSTFVINRLGRLSPAATQLAHAVAVLGSDATLHHAVTLAGLSDEAGAGAADALGAQGILRIGRRLEFVHPLVRAAVAEHMPAATRLLAHARAARLLAAAGADADAVAAQLLATQPSGDGWVVRRLQAAAQLAGRRGAPSAAVAYLRRAVEESPPTPELLHALGRAEIRAGASGAAAAHLDEALRGSEQPAQRADIGADLMVVLGTTGRYGDAARVGAATLEQAAALDPDVVAAIRGQMLQMATLEPSLRPAVDALLPDVDAPHLAGRTRGAREYLAALTTHAALTLRSEGDARRAARRAVDAGIGDELTTGPMAWTNTVYPAIVADDFELADVIIGDAFERLARTASVVGAARAHAARSMLHLRRGELRDAVADGHVAVSTGRDGGFYIWVLGLSSLVEALAEQGEAEAAAELVRETGQEGALPDSFLHFWLLHARGRLRLAQGDPGAAAVDFEEGLRRGVRRRLANPALVPYRASLALAIRSHDADRARALADEELRLARRWGAPRTIGVALRVAGLTRPDARAALGPLRDSVAALAGSAARLEHGRSLIELGAALRRSGRRSDARENLYAGMEIAHSCGAEPLVARARDELVASGARPRRATRSGVDALTASELRVARLAAEGKSNREIAQALYVTLRTVEQHLTHVYQKLDISGRGALADALA